MPFKLTEQEESLLDKYLTHVISVLIDSFFIRINEQLSDELKHESFTNEYNQRKTILSNYIMNLMYESNVVYSWVHLEEYMEHVPLSTTLETYSKIGASLAIFQKDMILVLEKNFPQKYQKDTTFYVEKITELEKSFNGVRAELQKKENEFNMMTQFRLTQDDIQKKFKQFENELLVEKDNVAFLSEEREKLQKQERALQLQITEMKKKFEQEKTEIENKYMDELNILKRQVMDERNKNKKEDTEKIVYDYENKLLLSQYTITTLSEENAKLIEKNKDLFSQLLTVDKPTQVQQPIQMYQEPIFKSEPIPFRTEAINFIPEPLVRTETINAQSQNIVPLTAFMPPELTIVENNKKPLADLPVTYDKPTETRRKTNSPETEKIMNEMYVIPSELYKEVNHAFINSLYDNIKKIDSWLISTIHRIKTIIYPTLKQTTIKDIEKILNYDPSMNMATTQTDIEKYLTASFDYICYLTSLCDRLVNNERFLRNLGIDETLFTLITSIEKMLNECKFHLIGQSMADNGKYCTHIQNKKNFFHHGIILKYNNKEFIVKKAIWEI